MKKMIKKRIINIKRIKKNLKGKKLKEEVDKKNILNNDDNMNSLLIEKEIEIFKNNYEKFEDEDFDTESNTDSQDSEILIIILIKILITIHHRLV